MGQILPLRFLKLVLYSLSFGICFIKVKGFFEIIIAVRLHGCNIFVYKEFINIFPSAVQRPVDLNVSAFFIVIPFVDKHYILLLLKKIRGIYVMGRYAGVCSMSQICCYLDRLWLLALRAFWERYQP